jgi:hypothetical protein
MSRTRLKKVGFIFYGSDRPDVGEQQAQAGCTPAAGCGVTTKIYPQAIALFFYAGYSDYS